MTTPLPPSTRPPARRPRRWRIVGAVAASLAIAATLVGAALAAILWTSPGRDLLLRVAENALGSAGRTVTIGGLAGPLPHAVRLTDVRLADDAGTWLTIGAVAIDWRPRALLTGSIDIASIAVADPVLLRPPIPTGSKGAGSATDPSSAAIALRVESLVIEGGRIGPGVFGESIDFRAAGGVANAGDQVWQGRLLVERTDGVPAQAELEGRYDAAADQLQMAARISEPAGGTIARALALPGLPAVTATFDGRGPLSAWRGNLAANAGPVGRVDSSIALRRMGDGGVAVDAAGRVAIDARLPARVTDFNLDRVDFDIALEWDGADSLTVRRGELTTASAGVGVSGIVDLAAAAIDVSTDIEAATWNDAAADVSVGPLSASIKVSGPWSAPTIDASAQLQNLRAVSASAPRVDLDISLSPVPTAPRTFAADLNATIHEPAAPMPLPALLGPTVAIAAAVQIAPRAIQVADLRLAGAHVILSGNADYEAATGTAAASVIVDVDTLQPLATYLPKGATGKLAVEAFVQRSSATDPITGTVALTVTDPALGDPALDAWLGPELVAIADVVAHPAEGLALPSIDIATGPIAVAGALSIVDAWQGVDATFQVTGVDLAAATQLAGTPLTGQITAAGQLSGVLADPDLHVSATAVGTSANGTAVPEVTATVDAARLITRQSGTVSVAGRGPAGPFKLATTVSHDTGIVRLDDVAATVGDPNGGSQARGAIAISLADGQIAGALAGRIADLAPWASLADIEAGGAVDFNVTADTGTDGQTIVVDLQGAEVTTSGIAVADALEISATLRGSTADIAVVGSGPYGGGVTVDAAAAIAWEQNQVRALVSRFDGKVAATEITLTSPATITAGAGALAVAETTLSIDGGQVTVSGRLDPDAVNATVDIAALPLALTRLILPDRSVTGELSASGRLTGTRAAPEAEVALEITDVALEDTPNVPPLSATADITWQGGRVNASGAIDGVGDPLTFNVALPLTASPPALLPTLPSDAVVAANVAWRGQIAEAWELLPLPAHRLAGKMELDLTAEGPLATPRVSGGLELTDGQYENLEIGTLLTDLQVAAKSDDADPRTILITVSANDGGDGTVAGQGSVGFAAPADPDLSMDITLRDLTLVRRDEVTAAGTGTVAISGTPTKASITGDVEVAPVEIRLLPSTLPPSVVALEVAEVDERAAAPTGPTPAAGTRGETNIDLDIAVTLPGRTFVRGRGLDSEWGGDIQLDGQASSPLVTGTLTALRGDFTFAGTSFDVRESTITFNGETKIDPTLNVIAEHQSRDITAIVRITGPASKPTVTLESRPALPQDEIVARMLFDTDVASLTPLQVAQLGVTVAQLTGGDASVIDRIREAVGVDRLNVGAGEDGAELTAGRYVGDAFVGVRQGTQPGSSAATVELEILPNVSLESEIGTANGAKTGIFWKRDY